MNKLKNSGLALAFIVIALIFLFIITNGYFYSERKIKAENVKDSTIATTTETPLTNTSNVDQAQLSFSESKILEASKLSNIELEKTFLKDARSLMAKEDTFLALKVNAYLRELEKRNINNDEINILRSDLLNKYSACWGIPAGQCME